MSRHLIILGVGISLSGYDEINQFVHECKIGNVVSRSRTGIVIEHLTEKQRDNIISAKILWKAAYRDSGMTLFEFLKMLDII